MSENENDIHEPSNPGRYHAEQRGDEFWSIDSKTGEPADGPFDNLDRAISGAGRLNREDAKGELYDKVEKET